MEKNANSRMKFIGKCLSLGTAFLGCFLVISACESKSGQEDKKNSVKIMRIKNKCNKLNRPLVGNARFLILLVIILASCKSKPHYPGPLSPEESVKTFHFAENFKAEIFATEPLVIDPVSMQYDGDGKAYVVEMADAYKPDSVKGKGKIVMLKDTNGDGSTDTAIVFADSLREPTSVLPWKGGLLICAAPNIIYYKDTDGDGRADLKEILFGKSVGATRQSSWFRTAVLSSEAGSGIELLKTLEKNSFLKISLPGS